MKRRRRISPDKIRQSIGGGWYERIPVPEKKECSLCRTGDPCPICKAKEKARGDAA